MEKESKHTKGEYSTYALKIVAGGKIIANVEMQDGEYGKYEASANAQRIVTAVNGYDELVECLKDCYIALKQLEGPWDGPNNSGIHQCQYEAFKLIKRHSKQH